jgi:glyoxylase-like metal-dependent hydrolase (beta-lactamase superfamily II)
MAAADPPPPAPPAPPRSSPGPAEPSAGLVEIVAGVYAWLQQPSSHDRTNAGVIVDDDGLTVVDTLMVPSQAEAFDAALRRFGVPVHRAVYTSSHIEFVGGSATFWMAARYGRSQTSALLDQPPNIAALQRLHPAFAGELELLAERPTRPVSHTVDVGAYLTTTHLVVPTQGQMLENLTVLLPEAGVLFAGAMACFGVTPNAFDGDPAAWADALGDLGELAAIIVPGIGPIGGADEVLALQAYLYACVDAEGDAAAIPPGPWDDWTDRHFDEVNVERAAMLAKGDRSVPPSILRLAGLG